MIGLADKHLIPLPSGERGRVRGLMVSNLVPWNYMENSSVPPSPLVGEGRSEGETY